MDFKITHDLPPKLSSHDWCAIDLELFGAEKIHLHRPTTGTFACLSICYNRDLVHVILNQDQVAEALQQIDDSVWVFYNAMFDITHLRRWAKVQPRKKLWDVMIVEREMCGGLYDDFSLEDVVRRRLDLRMNKAVRDAFEKTSQMNDEQLHYAANDAWVTLQACEHQRKEIDKKTFSVWTDIDCKAFWPMLDFQGFRINPEAWKTLAETNKARAEAIKAEMPFNPASPKQVMDALTKAGFKRLKDTEKPTVKRAMIKYPKAQAIELAKEVLEYRTYAKRASTYGMNFIEDFLEKESEDVYFIRASFWVVGTEHGRTSSSKPNLQNIIARGTDEFRRCFIARPGHKLVIADMGQQETRIAAFLSQDQKLIDILCDTSQDIFVGMAKLIYNKDITKDDPFRKQVKNTTYGILYGMSPRGMEDEYGIPEKEAATVIEEIFNAFPQLYSWICQQRSNKKYVKTIAGRKAWLNPYSEQCERNAVNDPVCGTAADQMKIALGNIYEKWNFPFPFACVGYIHDELIFDVPEEYAQDVGELVSHEMIAAAESQCPGVPFKADFCICDSWADKE